ncbi:CBD9-like protein [Thozetella sp. PMI_491]|nr:CBD9-like protein [Thozetella sp. PMI_491]
MYIRKFDTLCAFSVLTAFLLDTTNAADNTVAKSAFLSPDGNIAFALSVPNTSTTDLFFSLAGKKKNAWTAVGLGSNDMKGALVLMIYSNDDNNVTISTRISTGFKEPSYNPELNVEALSGTGIPGDTDLNLVFSGVCHKCRSWDGGSLDLTSTAAPFMFAVGPEAYLISNDPSLSVPYHAEYGSFTLDLKQATGLGGVPSLDTNTGSAIIKTSNGQVDIVARIHGIILMICLLGLFPSCLILLDVFKMAKTYLFLEILSVLVFIVGTCIGIYGSTYYTKTRDMRTAHQIIGLTVFCLLLLLSLMGCVLYPKYRSSRRQSEVIFKTSSTLWLVIPSWLVLLLGCIDAFLGFPLSWQGVNDRILGGVFAAVAVICVATYSWGMHRRNRV